VNEKPAVVPPSWPPLALPRDVLGGRKRGVAEHPFVGVRRLLLPLGDPAVPQHDVVVERVAIDAKAAELELLDAHGLPAAAVQGACRVPDPRTAGPGARHMHQYPHVGAIVKTGITSWTERSLLASGWYSRHARDAASRLRCTRPS
jgi:hypothetical protein